MERKPEHRYSFQYFRFKPAIHFKKVEYSKKKRRYNLSHSALLGGEQIPNGAVTHTVSSNTVYQRAGLLPRIIEAPLLMVTIMKDFGKDRPGWKEVFTPWITDSKTGKRRYPKNGKVFHFWVKDNNSGSGENQGPLDSDDDLLTDEG